MSDAAAPPVLEARGLTTGYDEVPIVRAVDMTFARGAITAIIGTNALTRLTKPHWAPTPDGLHALSRTGLSTSRPP